MKNNITRIAGKGRDMNTFGTKALLRAMAIFFSVVLVKFGIEMIPLADGIALKALYAVAILVAVLLMIIAPNFIPIRRKDPNQDRKAEK